MKLSTSAGVALLIQSFRTSTQHGIASGGIHFQMALLTVTASILGHPLHLLGYEYLQASLISTRFVGIEYLWKQAALAVLHGIQNLEPFF